MSIPAEIECTQCGGTAYLDDNGEDSPWDLEYTCDTCGDTQTLTADEIDDADEDDE
jgi:Zn finger protein HypA/HybF involved in hydrogenase expression